MRSLLTITLTFIFVWVTAQAPREKWGSPTEAELTMATFPADPTANAAILNNYGHYYFNRHYYHSSPELRTIYHYQVRLKIFSEEGKKHATVTIPYRGFDQYEDVVEISAVTYNLENGKVVKTKLKHKTIEWKREGSKMWYCTFTFPNVKPGSVIEYTYKIASLDFVKLRDWMFQKDIPVMNSDITLTTPNFFQFAFFSNMPSHRLETQRSDNMQYIQFYNTNIYVSGSKLQLTARNIPAFRKEAMMPDSNRVILKGEFLLSSAITRPIEFARYHDYFLMPYLKPILLTTTDDFYEPMHRMSMYNEILAGYKILGGMDWDSFVKKLSKDEAFGKGMLKAFENKELVDSFRKVEAGRKRMIAVYDYIRHHMRWNGEYRIFASASMEKIFERRGGYSSDINMLLINLLNRVGIQARPVLISTRSYGDVYKEMGFFRKFNHVIVSVELNGTRYLLDATDPHRPYNLLSIDDLNGEGLLVNLLDYKWISIENPVESAMHFHEDVMVNSGGDLMVAATITCTGYPAWIKKLEQITTAPDNERKVLAQNDQEPLVYRETSMQKLPGESTLTFAPFSYHSPFNQRFDEENRQNAVDFQFPRTVVRQMVIKIPPGYHVTRLPEDREIVMQGNFASFRLSTSTDGDTIRSELQTTIHESLIPSRYYQDLRMFYMNLKKAEQEQVTLTLTQP